MVAGASRRDPATVASGVEWRVTALVRVCAGSPSLARTGVVRGGSCRDRAIA